MVSFKQVGVFQTGEYNSSPVYTIHLCDSFLNIMMI